MERLSIKEWAEDDRPREKLIQKGASALSDAELLAILIGSGNSKESAVALCKRILNNYNNKITTLARCSIKELTSKFNGIGEVKAVTILAAIELAKRHKRDDRDNISTIKSSKDVHSHFYSLMSDLHHEEFWVILLNPANQILATKRISQGGIAATSVDIKIILRHALIEPATHFIACHNHPSGNINPSPQDNILTQKLSEAARMMDMRLLDHIIFSSDSHYSYADSGKL
ncbi:MAG: RadC family protein [Bacteroidales bacterium]